MCHYYHKKQNVGICFFLFPRSEALVVPNCQKRATLKPHDYMYTHNIMYVIDTYPEGHHRCFVLTDLNLRDSERQEQSVK